MEIKRLLLLLTLLSFSSLVLFGCAGTRQSGDSAVTGEKSEQDDLEDIEALLGISRDDNEQVSDRENDSDHLGLLDTDDTIPHAETLTAEEKRALELKVSRLENQVKNKDIEIASLNSKLQAEKESKKSASVQNVSAPVTGSPGAIDVSQYKTRYQEARAAFESRNYKLAIEYFGSLLAASSTHSLSDNAQYWIGECHYALKQYDAAIIDFEKVLTFSNSNKKADAQLKLGMCYLRKGDRTKAAEEFERLRYEFPDSKNNDRAAALMSSN